MFAKMTSPTQLTIPASILQALGSPDCFTIDVDNGRLVLTPTDAKNAAEVRNYLEEIGITEQDVTDAIAWARAK